jgi:excisionase family DNA binding protein
MSTSTGRGYTVRDLCDYFRVSKSKILAWIDAGELRATNTAAHLCTRPRWVVSAAALQEFELRRAGGPPPKAPRRKRQPAVRDYYPD